MRTLIERDGVTSPLIRETDEYAQALKQFQARAEIAVPQERSFGGKVAPARFCAEGSFGLDRGVEFCATQCDIVAVRYAFVRIAALLGRFLPKLGAVQSF